MSYIADMRRAIRTAQDGRKATIMSNTNIRNGAQSTEYHAARLAACTDSIMRGDFDAFDAFDAYDGAGCFMPEGGLSDDQLAAIAMAEFLAALQ